MPELLDESGRLLKLIGENLDYAVVLWDFVEHVEEYMIGVRKQPWAQVDLEDMEAQSLRFNGTIRAMPDTIRFSKARSWMVLLE